MLDNEVLMMEALDGTISPSDRARLEAYLTAHPETRAMFDAMHGVDVALREAPAVAPGAAFTQKVMSATRSMTVARPMKGATIALLVGTNALLVMAGWALLTAAVAGIMYYVAPSSVFELVGVFARSTAGVLGTLGRAGRVLFAQPAVWAILFASVVIVAIWLRVVTRLLHPAHGLALQHVKRL
jgi:anti-sigma factor RsiW